MKKLSLFLVLLVGSLLTVQAYTADFYWYGVDCTGTLPPCSNTPTYNTSNFGACSSTTTANASFYVYSTMSYGYCSIASNPYQFYVYIYRNGTLYTSGYATTSSGWCNLPFTLSESGTYQAYVDFRVKKPSNCFSYASVYGLWTNSITYTVNQNIVNNWALTYGASSITATPTPSSASAICASQINNLAMNTSGSSGTINNYFVEIAEVNSSGSYVGGSYFSNWYSSFSSPVNLAGLLSSGFLQGNRFYKIKLALQGPCNSWSEKSVWIYIASGCKNDGSEELADGDIGNSDMIESKISTYPNPFGNSLTFDISLQKPTDVFIRLFNINGQEMLRKEISNTNETDINVELSTADLPKGTYIYQVIADKVITGKLIK